MRKNFIILLVVIIMGVFSGKFIYDKINDVYAFSTKNEQIAYFLQLGIYSSEESMNSDTNSITNKLVIKKNNNYYVYVGISMNKDNLKKVCSLYQKLGYNLYFDEVYIDNKEYLYNLEQFDLLLAKAKSNDEIESINSVILSSYEEMVLNK